VRPQSPIAPSFGQARELVAQVVREDGARSGRSLGARTSHHHRSTRSDAAGGRQLATRRRSGRRCGSAGPTERRSTAPSAPGGPPAPSVPGPAAGHVPGGLGGEPPAQVVGEPLVADPVGELTVLRLLRHDPGLGRHAAVDRPAAPDAPAAGIYAGADLRLDPPAARGHPARAALRPYPPFAVTALQSLAPADRT
jgi:hypothetical protein